MLREERPCKHALTSSLRWWQRLGFRRKHRTNKSGALSDKPRVVRGLGQLGIALSEFEVKVLAER